MSDEDFEDVKKNKLENRHNFLSWRRYFERTAKDLDVWDIITGYEHIVPEPSESVCAVPITTTDDYDPQNPARIQIDGPRSLLKYQAAYKRYENNKVKVKLARKLINRSVCEAIAIEINEKRSPKETYDYLVKTYGISDERARAEILLKTAALKLDKCSSMTDYLNKHKEYKLDLARFKYDYTYSVMTANVLAGLPDTYIDFKKRWEWKRAEDPTKEPDIHFLTDRLLAEESDLLSTKGKGSKTKRESKNENKTQEKNSDKKCTNPNCPNPIGHVIEKCWDLHPELKPKKLREKEKAESAGSSKTSDNDDSKPKAEANTGRRFGGMVSIDKDQFSALLKEADTANDHSTTRAPILEKASLEYTYVNSPFVGGSESTGFRRINCEEVFQRLNPFHYRQLRYITVLQTLGNLAHSHLPRFLYSIAVLSKALCKATARHLNIAEKALSLAKGLLKPTEDGTTDNCSPENDSPYELTEASLGGQKFVAALTAGKACRIGHDTWIADTGANMHVCNDKRWFTKLSSFEYHIDTAQESNPLMVLGGGSCCIPVLGEDGIVNYLELSEVAYAPDASCNLLSLSLLGKKGKLEGRWNADSLSIETTDHYLIGKAIQYDGLYHLDTVTPAVSNDNSGKALAAIDLNNEVWDWHRRLGHLGWQNMRNLLKISNGCTLSDEQIRSMLKTICPVCAVTKALTIVPREPAKRRAQEVGGLFHADVWGPYGIPGYDGTKYFLFFTDDKTRFSWCEGFSEMKQMPSVFKAMHKKIEKSLNITIRNYRIAGEFQVGEVASFLQRNHIGTEPTVAYQHYMSGVIERGMRTVREKANPMMTEIDVMTSLIHLFSEKSQEFLRNSSIPELLWPESMKHAVWLRNRAPTRALNNKQTPWEALYGHQPSLDREHVFASRVFVTLPPELGRDSLPKIHGKRGWMGYYVGCDSESIYRIFSAEKHRVFRVGVARVDEGVGTIDAHLSPSLNDRLPLPADFQPDTTITDEEEELIDDGDHDLSTEDDHNRNTPDTEALDDGNYQEDDESPFDFYSNSSSEENDSDSNPVEDEVDDKVDEVDDGADPQRRTQEPEEDREPSNLEPQLPRTSEKNVDSNKSDDDSIEDKAKGKVEEVDDDDSPETPKKQPVPKPKSNKGPPVEDSDSDSDSDSDHEVGETVSKYFAGMHYRSIPPCRFCYQMEKPCWKETLDGPCRVCVSANRNCYSNLEGARTKTENREAKAKAIGQPVIPPCRRCYIDNRTCKRKSARVKCLRCKNRKLTCTNDLTGAIPYKSKYQKKKAPPPKKEAPPELVCIECRRHKRICDGERPCNHCKRLNKKCKSTELDAREPCAGCSAGVKKLGKTMCDRKRPCNRCIEKGQNCIYREQDGLVRRVYGGPHVTKESDHNPLPVEEDDERECRHCILIKRNCDGGTPCYRCVRHGERICAYDLPGRIRELYEVRPYVLINDEVHLRDDWEKHTETHGISVIHDSHVTVAGEDNHARQRFNAQFPDGYSLISTSGVNLQCGLRALRASLRAHGPGPVPTITQLEDVLNSPDITSFEEETGAEARDNTNNFYIDQLAAILRLWGQERNLDLQLGYILADGRVFLVPTPTTSETRIIWIHSTSSSGNDGDKLQHYEGVNPSIPHRERPKKSDGQPREEQDDTSSESSEDDEVTKNFLKEDGLDADVNEYGNTGSMLSKLSHTALMVMAVIAPSNTYSTVVAPLSYTEATKRPDSEEWMQAIDREDESLHQNNTLELIDASSIPAGRRPITSKYVFKLKILYDPILQKYYNKYKVRLVARGFQQEEGVDYDETFATVVKGSSYKILLALAGALGRHIFLMDVKTAFLHGELHEEIYMKPPIGMKIPPGKLFRLRKALYGLKQAPRAWYERLTTTLVKMGFRISTYDPCVFIQGDGHIIVAIWVDDLMIISEDDDDTLKFRESMKAEFEMVDEGLCTYYLGMNMEQGPDGLYVHQKRYVDDMLVKFGLTDITKVKTPMDTRTTLRQTPGYVATASYRQKYQSMVGSLLWLSNQTRPDITFATNYVARFSSNPEKAHMGAVLRIFAYVAGTTSRGLLYTRISNAVPVGFSDADFAGCVETRKSTTGYVYTMAGSAVSWSSKRQKSVSSSTMDAEYMAASAASKEAVWIRRFVNDLGVRNIHADSITLGIDNEAAEGLTRNPIQHNRAKHIDVQYHFVRDRVINVGDIKTVRVTTKENIADIFTKALLPSRHEYLIKKLGLTDGA